jgi:hypothetical protein
MIDCFWGPKNITTKARSTLSLCGFLRVLGAFVVSFTGGIDLEGGNWLLVNGNYRF